MFVLACLIASFTFMALAILSSNDNDEGGNVPPLSDDNNPAHQHTDVQEQGQVERDP